MVCLNVSALQRNSQNWGVSCPPDTWVEVEKLNRSSSGLELKKMRLLICYSCSPVNLSISFKVSESRFPYQENIDNTMCLEVLLLI